MGNVPRCNTWDEAVENHHAKVSALQTGGTTMPDVKQQESFQCRSRVQNYQ